MTDREALVPRSNPIEHFAQWMQDALEADFIEPYAITLATANAEGRPSARQVLLKSYADSGFVFYTNYESRKSQELLANPYASFVIWWDKLYRQVRVEGKVARVEDSISDDYFSSRPRGSQLSAVVSPQSRPIESREWLVSRVAELERRHEGRAIPRPDYWGGFRLEPEVIEFWQHQDDRLHDRLRYERKGGDWKTTCLAP